jgi:hypothetical protein
MDEGKLDMGSEIKIIDEIRKAISRGIVLYNYASDDLHNPLDRQLEIYTYIKLSDINPALEGIVKLRVLCRLSIYNGILTLRSINRNFEAE